MGLRRVCLKSTVPNRKQPAAFHHQALRIAPHGLQYQAFTAGGALYDSFRIERDRDGNKALVELEDGRIAPRNCGHRQATARGRRDRCWE